MKNALIYNYNIYVNNLSKINDNYYFNFQNNDYVIAFFNRDINESTSIYNLNLDMQNKKIETYKIVLTKDKNILFLYKNYYYILMIIPKIKNRIITFDDILNFNYNYYDNKIDKSNWGLNWSNKIDYIEEEFLLLKNKYPLINNSINYYIGIWENGISYFNLINKNLNKVICHKRVGVDTDLLTYLNPLNLVIDYKERDIGEYLKSYIYEKNWTSNNINILINKLNLNKESLILLISRLLFPSYYFDIYEDIILNKKEENEINKITKNINIIFLIKILFDKYNFYNIPIIEWIIKEE